MIVDTSAIMAVVLKEAEKDAFLAAMVAADRLLMSAGNWLELEAVIVRRGTPMSGRHAERLIAALGISIEPFSVEQARIARSGYRQFGRGTQHAAGLNFGDCFAYALAKETGDPLLFKGDDFRRTGIASAL